MSIVIDGKFARMKIIESNQLTFDWDLAGHINAAGFAALDF